MAKAKVIKTVNKQESLIDDKIDKYFWLIIPVLTILYYWISYISVGFYQDDEIAQYLNAIKFQVDPFSILGNNPKPGWKLFLIIPAMIDYKAVLMFNALVASLAVFFTFKFLKEYKLNYAFFGALLLAVQPLFFDLSFRTYSEIFTALLIVIFLILYKREKYILAGLLIGFILTIRQELIIFAFVLFIIFLYKKKYIPAIAIAVFPIIYNLLGMIKTGDPLFVLTEMKAVAGLQYNSQGIFHYFKVYIFIVGPITLLLFLQGFFGFFADTKNYKTYIEKYFLLYLLFITVFGVQMYTMMSNGPNPGNWRYLLHISPVAVLFANIGFNNLSDNKFKRIHYFVTGLLFFLTLLFLSKESDGFRLLESDDYTKVAFITIFFVATLLIPSKDKIAYLNKLSVVLILVSILYLYVDFKPKKLSPENQTVKTVAESLNSNELSGNFYTNHSVLLFYLDNYKKEPRKYLPINSKYFNDIPKGSILVWETHYGYRPEFGNDIKIEDIQKNSDYKIINQYVSIDKRFAAYIIEKVN